MSSCSPRGPQHHRPPSGERHEHFLGEVGVQRRTLAGLAAHDRHVEVLGGDRGPRVRVLEGAGPDDAVDVALVTRDARVDERLGAALLLLEPRDVPAHLLDRQIEVRHRCDVGHTPSSECTRNAVRECSIAGSSGKGGRRINDVLGRESAIINIRPTTMAPGSEPLRERLMPPREWLRWKALRTLRRARCRRRDRKWTSWFWRLTGRRP